MKEIFEAVWNASPEELVAGLALIGAGYMAIVVVGGALLFGLSLLMRRWMYRQHEKNVRQMRRRMHL